MGGARETVLDSIENPNNPIRIHEKDDEVHFHDDNAKTKCAVKIDDFKPLWQDFIDDPENKNGEEIILHDDKRKTCAVLTMIVKDKVAEVDIVVEKADLDTGPNFDKIQGFLA